MGVWLSAASDSVEVVPGLWIGAAPSARGIRHMVRSGITAVVDLTGIGAAAPWPDSVTVECYPLAEYEPPAREALADVSSRVAELLTGGHTVLVHCRAGVQRAPLIACATLVQMGWPLAAAVDLVRARRVVAAMSEAQLVALKEFAAEAQNPSPEARAATA